MFDQPLESKPDSKFNITDRSKFSKNEKGDSNMTRGGITSGRSTKRL